MRFNKDVEYALIGLMAMTKSDALVSAREISDDFAVPYGLLAKILQRLASSNVLESVKGAHGGYRLSRAPEEITLGEIIDAVEGKRHVARCLDDEACSQVDLCNIKGSIRNVQSMWDELVSSMSLGDFARRRERTGVT